MNRFKFLASGVGIAALALVTSANAADLPPRVAYKAPPPVAAPVPYNWTGFYIGGHFGGGWARKAWEDRGAGSDLCLGDLADAPDVCLGDLNPGGDAGSHNAIGPLGGFQAGFNWQAPGSHWVLGIEGQYSFADLKGDHQNNQSAAGFFSESGDSTWVTGSLHDRFSTRVTDIATLAGRIGITSDWMDRTLFYVKGGGAWARDKYKVNSQFSANACVVEEDECFIANGTGSWSGSESRWGWMAGIGLEFGLFGNWTAKIEYDYLGFGTKTVTLRGGGSATVECDGDGCSGDSPASGSADFSRTFRINENIQLIKLGLNYRFNFGKAAPVVARY